MGNRKKRKHTADRAILKIGSPFDRFKSKLPIACRHSWQPFGVPIVANGVERETLRCQHCKNTKTARRLRGAA